VSYEKKVRFAGPPRCSTSSTGGHGWPGQSVPAMEKLFGPEMTQIDATDPMMSFFFAE
jgi:poly(3-hydroxybutyrate) depolymerase